jgi:hypothetical protein
MWPALSKPVAVERRQLSDCYQSDTTAKQAVCFAVELSSPREKILFQKDGSYDLTKLSRLREMRKGGTSLAAIPKKLARPEHEQKMRGRA